MLITSGTTYVNKREHKERSEDTKFDAVAAMSVNGAVLQYMIRVQDLHIHMSYPEGRSRNFLRNVCSVSALPLVATTQRTITKKYDVCWTVHHCDK